GNDGAIGSGLDQAGRQAEGSDERLGGGEGVGRGSRAAAGEEAGPQAGASDQGNDGGPGADMEGVEVEVLARIAMEHLDLPAPLPVLPDSQQVPVAVAGDEIPAMDDRPLVGATFEVDGLPREALAIAVTVEQGDVREPTGPDLRRRRL